MTTMRTLPLPERFDPETQGMLALFASQLEDQTERLREAVKSLTVDQLEYQPTPGMNTIGMLIAHIAVAEAYWMVISTTAIASREDAEEKVREIIGIRMDDDGLPLPENGTHPEALRGKTIDEYLTFMDRARVATLNVLSGWKDKELELTYEIRDRKISRSWTIYHILEHLCGHFGQILMLRHMIADREKNRG